MTKKTRFLVTDGGIAGDIKSELGPHAKSRKVMPNEPVGDYGNHIFEGCERDAVFMMLKYPNAVTIL